jgi:uncharacterized protein YfiM (DUF2279 family)
MRLIFLFLICIHCSNFGISQDENILKNSDSLNKKRIVLASSGIIGVWTGSTIALQSIWYAAYPQVPFHTFDDSKSWLQMDKMGHLFSANKLSTVCYSSFRWGGLSKNKSVLLGAISGLGYLTTLELMDARNEQWGFSWSDMGANLIGTSIFALERLFSKENAIQLKFSFSKSPYAAVRPNILGQNYQEQLLKDYNGQTYWISIQPQQWFNLKNVPNWISLAFGYSVNEKLVGDASNYYDALTSTYYSSYREFIFSLDINLNQLPIRSPLIKAILKPFNSIKIPFPSVILSQNQLHFRELYF